MTIPEAETPVYGFLVDSNAMDDAGGWKSAG
jgi:hypothetical protein